MILSAPLRRSRLLDWVGLCCALVVGGGAFTAGDTRSLAAAPSHDRLWRIEQAVLPFAVFGDHGVTVHNVRQCRWWSEEDKDVRHSDWTFAWSDVRGVDFAVVPFADMPLLSHTMLSFRLADGRCLVVSVEARLEQGEKYSAIAGAARQFELMYVLGDEPDLFGLRTEVRRDDLYLYEMRASGAEAARLLRDILERVQRLVTQPEFYDSLTNNCTTNLVDHLHRTELIPLPAGPVEQVLEVLTRQVETLPGQSDRLAYSLGLLKTNFPFEEARRRAWISNRVRQHLGDPQFSWRIRERATPAVGAVGYERERTTLSPSLTLRVMKEVPRSRFGL